MQAQKEVVVRDLNRMYINHVPTNHIDKILLCAPKTFISATGGRVWETRWSEKDWTQVAFPAWKVHGLFPGKHNIVLNCFLKSTTFVLSYGHTSINWPRLVIVGYPWNNVTCLWLNVNVMFHISLSTWYVIISTIRNSVLAFIRRARFLRTSDKTGIRLVESERIG